MTAISIILNLYNSAQFIAGAINTLQNQTFKDFEIIAVDDGSNDNSLELITAMTDARIKVYSYPNGGIAKSRNRGLAKATGEFVAFLDHDDLWHAQKLEKQWQLLTQHPDAGFAYSWVNIISETGTLIRRCQATQADGDIYTRLLARNFLYTASNPLLRRRTIMAVGGFDEEIYGADEWDLFLRMAKHAPVVVSPYHHIYYRVVKGSGSARVEKLEQGCLKVIDKACRMAPAEVTPILPKTKGRLYQFLCFRILEERATWSSGWQAFLYFSKSYQNYPQFWDFTPMMKALIKIAFVIILPPKYGNYIISWLESQSRKNASGTDDPNPVGEDLAQPGLQYSEQ
jgi:glycosyltransferase involved in cell wall biosynthesis